MTRRRGVLLGIGAFVVADVVMIALAIRAPATGAPTPSDVTVTVTHTVGGPPSSSTPAP